MKDRAGAWVRLQLKPAAYADFGIVPVLIPVRIEVLEGLSASGVGLSAEAMATEIVAYLGERPEDGETYRPLLGELAYSVGSERGMAGDHEAAVYWLEKAAHARPGDIRVLGNFARALVRSGRPDKALEICENAQRMALDIQGRTLFSSVEKEGRDALGKTRPVPSPRS